MIKTNPKKAKFSTLEALLLEVISRMANEQYIEQITHVDIHLVPGHKEVAANPCL